MRYWQVWKRFGGYWMPTTEYVYAADHAAALDEFNSAMANGNSGFSTGEFKVEPVNGMPSSFRGVPTRLAVSRVYVGK